MSACTARGRFVTVQTWPRLKLPLAARGAAFGDLDNDGDTDVGGARQVFDVTGAGSYLSTNDTRLLVGLGTRAAVRTVGVRWPGGKVQTLNSPAVDSYHTVREQ